MGYFDFSAPSDFVHKSHLNARFDFLATFLLCFLFDFPWKDKTFRTPSSFVKPKMMRKDNFEVDFKLSGCKPSISVSENTAGSGLVSY